MGYPDVYACVSWTPGHILVGSDEFPIPEDIGREISEFTLVEVFNATTPCVDLFTLKGPKKQLVDMVFGCIREVAIPREKR